MLQFSKSHEIMLGRNLRGMGIKNLTYLPLIAPEINDLGCNS